MPIFLLFVSAGVLFDSAFFPVSILKDTLFKQQQKYKIVSYLEPDLREIA